MKKYTDEEIRKISRQEVANTLDKYLKIYQCKFEFILSEEFIDKVVERINKKQIKKI